LDEREDFKQPVNARVIDGHRDNPWSALRGY